MFSRAILMSHMHRKNASLESSNIFAMQNHRFFFAGHSKRALPVTVGGKIVGISKKKLYGAKCKTFLFA